MSLKNMVKTTYTIEIGQLMKPNSGSKLFRVLSNVGASAASMLE